MSSPVFDHSGSAAEGQEGSQRFLEQGGERFSYAVFNRQTRRFEPDPVWIPRGQKSFDELKVMASNITQDIRALRKSIDAFTEAVNNKIELGAPPWKPAVSTSPYEDAYLNDLPAIPPLVEQPSEQLEADVKKKPRAPRKRSGGRPKKVTV
jgi:hypothetical protein